MAYQGKIADYKGFEEDLKKGLSKADLLKKYQIKTDTAYKTYLYRARALGILKKGELPGKPPGKAKPEKQKRREPESQRLEKVTFQLPGDLVKRIKYKAIDQDKRISQVVRETLEKHI